MPRVRDPELLRSLHLLWRHCALCFEAGHEIPEPPAKLSLHHVLKHPRDDVRGNMVMLCGDGTTGHHGLVEAHDREACVALARFIRRSRPDTFAHLCWRLDSAIAADDWLSRLARATA